MLFTSWRDATMNSKCYHSFHHHEWTKIANVNSAYNCQQVPDDVPVFLLLTRYVPNVTIELRSSVVNNITYIDVMYDTPLRYVKNVARVHRRANDWPTDRPTTDLASWKISNCHISATGHQIHLKFGSRTGVFGFGGSNGPNPDWTKSTMAAGRHLRRFRIAIYLQRFIRSTSY